MLGLINLFVVSAVFASSGTKRAYYERTPENYVLATLSEN